MIIVISLYFFDRKHTRSPRRTLFWICLGLSAFEIILNAACVLTIRYYALVPQWLNVLLNSLYFLVTVWTCSILALYIFNLLLEHVYEKHCLIRAVAGLVILNALFLILVIINFRTGVLFWFDADGGYHRGLFNNAGYAVMLAEVCMVIMCYVRNRSSVSKNVFQVIRTLPPIVLGLAAFQLIYPQILLNGVSFAFVDLVLFINFQNYQVGTDSLTRIGNRRNFYQELSLRIAGKQKFQIISISLKHFVVVNQRFGYQIGDDFLYTIASWLEKFDQDSRAFRFGNVSFALVSPFLSEEKAAANLKKVRDRFEEGWSVGDIRFDIMACFSEIIRRDQNWQPDQVIEYLEFMNAMAKQEDIASLRFTKEIEQKIERKKILTELLKLSIKKDRFQIWYQPVIDCTSGKYLYAEALLRLSDCSGVPVSPNEFIPLAEETGLIDEMSWIVLEKVCRLLGETPSLDVNSISINLSMQQFLDPHIAQRIADCLKRHHVPPEKLKIEITERVIAYDLPYISSVMARIREAGIGFYLDDFGVGYSNFSSIMRLPFECVKLDRSLFSELLVSEKDRTIVQTMIELAHSVGFQVVSEGIETQEQAELLSRLGTDRIQGYYFARPMPEKEFLAFKTENDH
ncbi:GGDEF domain-containing phosphodiesterase [Anaerovorax odorimutans]|uniref:GGDEF domain-containing phosphodiesterase n=1 Tax=Anaerovorax odorimutans TaxID=109327 RepID=A0ABT1RMB4_9FIRM|nr:GGDEF domain-containing phosphodiesterase [Anaerovorax odorimutans]